MKNHARSLALLASLCLAASAMAEQIIVDPEGTGDAVAIQAGVDLANEGDVVIVYPGVYREGVVISNGVWLVAQTPLSVEIEGHVHVEDVGALSTVVLSGLRVTHEFNPQSGAQTVALVVRRAKGPVIIDGCEVLGSNNWSPPFSSCALFDGARRVSVSRSTFRGADGVNFFSGGVAQNGAGGLELRDSRAAVWGGSITGGIGSSATIFTPGSAGDGGSGVSLTRSRLFLSGVSVEGGNGGDYSDFLAHGGGDGGDAVFAGMASDVFLQDVGLVAGRGGLSTGVGANGQNGTVLAGTGAAQMLSGDGQDHTSARWAFAQSTIDVTLRGAPGDAVDVLLTTGQPPFLFDALGASRTGRLLLDEDVVLASAGMIGANGELMRAINIPALPASPSVATATFFGRTSAGPAPWNIGAPMPVVGVNCSTYQPDCNGNGIGDLCEIVQGTVLDIDGNGIPDDCNVDCNGNGTLDWIDVLQGFSQDLNGNGIPDECEPVFAAWYVDPLAPPGGDGSPSLPFTTIGAAARSSLPNHEIVLRDGIYRSSDDFGIHFGVRGVTIRSENGRNQCTIDMGGLDRAFVFDGVPALEQVEIRGITFTNGVSTVVPLSSGVPEEGGAILSSSSKLIVRDCIFESCQSLGGGAISVQGGTLDLRDSTFFENRVGAGNVSNGGGAVRCDSCIDDVVVDNCRFIRNGAVSAGGAIRMSRMSAARILISRSQFFDQGTGAQGQPLRGGAIALSDGGDWHVDQCLMLGNVASQAGAISVEFVGVGYVSHSTILENSAQVGGGLVARGTGPLSIFNSILRGNVSTAGSTISWGASTSTLSLRASNLEGGASISGLPLGSPVLVAMNVIDADPLFVDLLGPDGDPATRIDNDYRLQAGSPSVDAGANQLLAFDVADLDGDGVVTERVPLDLDETSRRKDDPMTPSTGQGLSPIVDHGPYER